MLKINNKHISEYGLKAKNIEIGIPAILSSREQISGTNRYINTGNKNVFGQRNIKIIFNQEGDYAKWLSNIEEISKDINGVEVEIELDAKPGFFYFGIASVTTTKENDFISNFEINVVADPLKYKDYISVSANATSSKTITVEGDYITPCVVEITPQVNVISSLTISGAARNKITGELEDILINNLTKDNKIVIDGENATVTEENVNKFADTEFWEYPTLLPGSNVLTFSNTQCNVVIKYKPRYI